MTAGAPSLEASASDLRVIDAAPMSRAQLTAVAITAVLSALDGYDVLSVTFAAPALGHTWHIGKAAIGTVLASGLLGMAAGSIGLAPLADKIGRRRVVLGSLFIMVLGGVWSALSRDVGQMTGSRVLTGLGIGTVIAVVTPLAAEFANARRRALAVTVMAIGYPIGGVLGGFAAAGLLRSYGWPAIFAFKALIALALIPAVARLLPESPAFLLAGKRPNSLHLLNLYLVRCGRGTLRFLPPPAPMKSSGYRALFTREMFGQTLRLTIANGLYVMTVYYFLSWLPQMIADAGFQASTASMVSSAANLSGVVGGLLLGVMAISLSLRRLVAGALAGLGLATALFGLTPPLLPALVAAAAACGFFLIAGISGLYATITDTFHPQCRASGSGLVIGVGRATSATAPYLAGWMFASGLTRLEVSLAFALLALAASVVILKDGRGAPRSGLTQTGIHA